LNRLAGHGPIAVGDDLYAIVRAAVDYAALTHGAFDITFATCGHLWSIAERRGPTQAQLETCLPGVGVAHIELNDETSSIALAEGTRIGIAAIGKGYGVDRAAALLEDHGFKSYLVEGGGDIRVRGGRLGEPWTVGIRHPRERGELLGALRISDGAVATSGDYEHYYVEDGHRRHHILDPRTGEAAEGAVAATVWAPTATEADALATAFMVLDPQTSLSVAAERTGVEAMIVDHDLAIYMTPSMERRFTSSAKNSDEPTPADRLADRRPTNDVRQPTTDQ
jgi:FAD:protein FMN transferase